MQLFGAGRTCLQLGDDLMRLNNARLGPFNPPREAVPDGIDLALEGDAHGVELAGGKAKAAKKLGLEFVEDFPRLQRGIERALDPSIEGA